MHENAPDTGDNRQEEVRLTIDLDHRIHRHPTLARDPPENHFPALHLRTRMKRPRGVEDNRANDIEVDKVVILSDFRGLKVTERERKMQRRRIRLLRHRRSIGEVDIPRQRPLGHRRHQIRMLGPGLDASANRIHVLGQGAEQGTALVRCLRREIADASMLFALAGVDLEKIAGPVLSERNVGRDKHLSRFPCMLRPNRGRPIRPQIIDRMQNFTTELAFPLTLVNKDISHTTQRHTRPNCAEIHNSHSP